MKKTGRILLLLAFVLVAFALNAIVFLTAPERSIYTPVFWVTWAFAVPWNLIWCVGLHLWASKKNGDEIVQMPIAYYLCYLFGGAYITVACLFIYKIPLVYEDVVNNVTIPLVIEIVLMAAHILVAGYSIFGAAYIARNERHVKQKVLFIRLLKSDVDGCAAAAKGVETKKALQDFADKIRFSDPMSHAALAGVEAELSATVEQIVAKIAEGAEEEAVELVKKGELQLERRNSRCLLLK
ncbi:MAG: hypothetical protein IJX91_02530 [Clostridia bacterium]|nr:hypothetical protein [Clostridia bacterium]